MTNASRRKRIRRVGRKLEENAESLKNLERELEEHRKNLAEMRERQRKIQAILDAMKAEAVK